MLAPHPMWQEAHRLPPLAIRIAGISFWVIALALIPLVLLRRKEPASTIAWILTLLFLPALGAFLFLAFGQERVRIPARRQRQLDAIARAELSQRAPARLERPGAEPSQGKGETELELSLFK